MKSLDLSEFGLCDVAGACAIRGWSPKSVQNWVRSGLLPALVIGSGRGATFLLRVADVQAFVTPPRGRPKISSARTR